MLRGLARTTNIGCPRTAPSAVTSFACSAVSTPPTVKSSSRSVGRECRERIVGTCAEPLGDGLVHFQPRQRKLQEPFQPGPSGTQIVDDDTKTRAAKFGDDPGVGRVGGE